MWIIALLLLIPLGVVAYTAITSPLLLTVCIVAVIVIYTVFDIMEDK